MTPPTPPDQGKPSPASWLFAALAWILVGIPLAWGVYRTLHTAAALFR